jgi:hypothetical protein
MKMNLISLIILSFMSISCNQKNQKMCDCLIVSEELNKYSNQLLMKEVNQEDLKKMKQLKQDKKTKCAEFQTMSGEKMLEMKKNCDLK